MVHTVNGLRYIDSYINETKHDELLALVNEQPWLTDLKRRVQHYGYRYDYKARAVTPDMYLGPLPAWLQHLAKHLNAADLMPAIPDQVIVNEYLPGQGIAFHVDCTPCFGDTIASLSLGSGCVMRFRRVVDAHIESVWLAPCSLVVMNGEARYQWQHGIPARKNDVVAAQKYPRTRRVSLTFRTVTISD
ncbi:MAG: alpha-ketoglutarate-dependent dioxygenase AlkB [Okeania sp. SIO3B3]|nr:alpha-ketoglutarate-dependent dioxygenase AlkB [Okeania sp. SIO3B3]